MDVDLYDLNLLFLQKARDWLASGQEHKARLLLGLTPDAAALLKRLPMTGIRDLAASNVLCLTLRFPPQLWRDLARESPDQPWPEQLRWHLLASAATPQDHDTLAP